MFLLDKLKFNFDEIILTLTVTKLGDIVKKIITFI